MDKLLPAFNRVNMSTAVSRLSKMQAAPGELARAIQHPAFASLKAAISAPQASSSASAPCCYRRAFALPVTEAGNA